VVRMIYIVVANIAITVEHELERKDKTVLTILKAP
jgi:hypothetical protein